MPTSSGPSPDNVSIPLVGKRDIERGETPTDEMEFPYKGDPFELLDEKGKKLFQACKELTFQTLEGLDEKAKNLLKTCEYLNQQTSEGLDEKAKKLLEACQDTDHNSINDLHKNTLKQTDKNGMNIFHVLLFDQKNEGLGKWYTKNLDIASRKKVVTIIEAICKKFPEEVQSMMIHRDSLKRTPLHYAGLIDVDGEKEDSNITLALLEHGADKVLFFTAVNQVPVIPVNFIGTSNLRVHLDTKQRIEGPFGHRVAHCDTSILQPEVKPGQKTIKLDHLWKLHLSQKHRDLFDHPVISAMIW